MTMLISRFVTVCDPVLGDNGALYVPEAFIEIYRDKLIPLADITTPNQFEAELLSGIKIETEKDAWAALDWFHDRGVKTVVLSSTSIGSPTHLKAFLSTKTENYSTSKFSILMPKLGHCNFTGTGDLFAALFLAHSTLSGSDQQGLALEKTVATIQAVIKNTIKRFKVQSGDNVPQAERELRIIHSIGDIQQPEIALKAERF